MKKRFFVLCGLGVGLALAAALAMPLQAGERSPFERAEILYDRYASLARLAQTDVPLPGPDAGSYGRLTAEGLEFCSYADADKRQLVRLPDAGAVSDVRVASDGGLLVSYGRTPIYRHSFSVDRLLYVKETTTGRERVRTEMEIAPDIDGKRDAGFSPDGRKIVFSSRNDLYLYDLNDGSCRRLTDDGAWNRIINGTTDWVYEEELGFTQAWSFSPDSRRIAWLKFDESAVPLFEMMRYDGSLYNRAYAFKYPKAGDTNSTVTLWTYDTERGTAEQVYTGPESDQYIPRIGWTPGGLLWYYRLDRRQRLFEIILDRPDEQQVIYAERSPRYVERPAGEVALFIDDDRFVVREETSAGWWHLYLYSVEKGRQRALTSGPWEVTALLHADRRGVWFLSDEESPLHRHLCRVDLRGGRRKVLTPETGWHAVAAGSDMRYFVDTWSTAGQAPVATVRKGDDGAVVRPFGTPAVAPDALPEAPHKEFFTFRTERGDALNAWVMKPRDFDPGQRYPVLLTQYSGPGSQQVCDSWRPDWTDGLVEAGYIVACVDPRGTGFRGEAFKKQTYGDLGRREVEDQLSFARYWAAQSYVDAGRIGIYGWSFGGFVSLCCALKGQDLFKMAIAVAPVTSWRYYDSLYTETYNGLPQEFPAGYDENSPLHFREKLSPATRLLLIHGSADDNVHLQNTMEMARRLNRDGAHYDMMIYPDQNHSMRPDDMRNIRVKMLGYTLEHL